LRLVSLILGGTSSLGRREKKFKGELEGAQKVSRTAMVNSSGSRKKRRGEGRPKKRRTEKKKKYVRTNPRRSHVAEASSCLGKKGLSRNFEGAKSAAGRGSFPRGGSNHQMKRAIEIEKSSSQEERRQSLARDCRVILKMRRGKKSKRREFRKA